MAFYNIIDLKAEVKESAYYRLFPNVVVLGYNDGLLTKLREKRFTKSNANRRYDI
jgi:hypothetical protein